MKTNEIMNTLGLKANKISFAMKKHSPEILVVAGVIGAVASAVLACRATTKISEILNDTKETVDAIHEAIDAKNAGEDIEYTEEDKKKDLMITYVHTGVSLAKLYAPAVILGTLSITSILASNNIMRKRNVALAAAYATIDKGYKEYRGRVVERFGENVDKELRYGMKAKEVEEKVVDEKGKEKTVKKSVDVVEPTAISDYAQIFRSNNPYWEDTPDYTEMFLRARQNWANDKLRANGHLTLNEVYTMLGFEETKAGMVVGWIYDPKNPVGDNYVDFGIHQVFIDDEKTNDVELAYALDFNVDGNIYEKM